MNTMHRVLGIDPGIGRMGWAVVTKEKKRLHAEQWGCVVTRENAPLAERLRAIADTFEKLIRRHRPTACAVEKIFFAKNTKTAMAVAHARGVVIALAAQHHLPVDEYTPLEVKQATTGYGRAEKRQVHTMIEAILNIRLPRSNDDAVDALAVAYTAFVSQKQKNKKTPVIL